MTLFAESNACATNPTGLPSATVDVDGVTTTCATTGATDVKVKLSNADSTSYGDHQRVPYRVAVTKVASVTVRYLVPSHHTSMFAPDRRTSTRCGTPARGAAIVASAT